MTPVKAKEGIKKGYAKNPILGPKNSVERYYRIEKGLFNTITNLLI